MFRRAVTFRCDPEAVWRAITEPAALEDWFGTEVELDLHPGGRAHFGPAGDDRARHGVVERVEPGRHLQFRWWPEEDDADVSEVSYELEPDGEAGATLTVTERRVPVGELRTSGTPTARSAATTTGEETVTVALLASVERERLRWSAGDQRSFEMWACADRPAVGAGR